MLFGDTKLMFSPLIKNREQNKFNNNDDIG